MSRLHFKKNNMMESGTRTSTCLYEPRKWNDCVITERKHGASPARSSFYVKTIPRPHADHLANCRNINVYYKIRKIIYLLHFEYFSLNKLYCTVVALFLYIIDSLYTHTVHKYLSSFKYFNYVIISDY